MPLEGLAPLNDKLFENACHLEPEKLIGLLNDIVTALGADA